MSVQYARADRRTDSKWTHTYTDNDRRGVTSYTRALDVDVAKAAAVKPFLSRSLGRKLRTRDDPRPFPFFACTFRFLQY